MKQNLGCYRRKVVNMNKKSNSRKISYQYQYYDLKTNRLVTDRELIKILNKAKVPPTYTKVTVCPGRDCLATGYDKTGQKQYFYHRDVIASRTKEKFCNLLYLADNLDRIIDDIDHIIAKAVISPDKSSKGHDLEIDLAMNAIALSVMILCNFRVGNESYKEENGTDGLTTITLDNIQLDNKGKVQIAFNGKKNQANSCVIRQDQTAKFLEDLVKYRQKLGNQSSDQTLFSFGNYQVTPRSMNEFLKKYHPTITTKTWRTWFANYAWIHQILQHSVPKTVKDRTRLSNQVIKTISAQLHHTPAINKRSYLIKELPLLYIDDPNKWSKLVKDVPTNSKKGHGDKTANILVAFLTSYCT